MSLENQNRSNEPQEVAVDRTTWESFSNYVGSRRQMDPHTLYMRSQINEDLRKPNGEPVSELEALAIFEGMQDAGLVSLDADDEGNFAVVQPPVDRDDHGHHERTAYDDIDTVRRRAGRVGNFLLGKTGTKVMGETVYSFRHYGKEYGKELPEKAAKKARGKLPAARREEAAHQERAEQERRAKIAWNAGRKTKLAVRSENSFPAEQQLDNQDYIEAQFNPAVREQLEYVNREMGRALEQELSTWKKEHQRRIVPQDEVVNITKALQEQIVREYLGEEADETQIEHFNMLLTWFATNKATRSRGRR